MLWAWKIINSQKSTTEIRTVKRTYPPWELTYPLKSQGGIWIRSQIFHISPEYWLMIFPLMIFLIPFGIWIWIRFPRKYQPPLVSEPQHEEIEEHWNMRFFFRKAGWGLEGKCVAGILGSDVVFFTTAENGPQAIGWNDPGMTDIFTEFVLSCVF